MIDLLPSPPLLLAFLAASLALAVTPGPAVLYILARSLGGGRRAGLVSVVGVALGTLGNAAGAALGLAALFAVSAAAFTAVKWLGAAYLVWLGFQAIRTARAPARREAAAPPAPLRRVFLDGAIIALLNPKTALFFAAFLPQFLEPGAGPLATLALGGLFVAVASTTDTLYVLAAGGLGPLLARRHRTLRIGGYLTGAVYLGLGLLTALGQRPAKP